jgi:hypothetical protein
VSDSTAQTAVTEPPAELVTLPHTGLRVPASPILSLRAVRSHDTDDGYAWTASLYRDGRKVGTAQHHGDGGEATWWSDDRVRFGDRELEEYVAACRDEHGEPVSVDFVLGSLCDEAISAKAVEKEMRRGNVPVRAMYAITNGDGDVLDLCPAGYYGLPPRHTTDLVALAKSLRKARPHEHSFQIFTDGAWKTLDETDR